MEIAFCFDENMLHAACVAIASLLDLKESDDHYVIHCICSEQAMKQEKLLAEIVDKRDKDSELHLYPAPDSFQNSYEVRGISTSTYLRLSLHRILSHLDKVIYADVDVLFGGSLDDMWNTGLGDKLLAGVRGANNFSDSWAANQTRDYAGELEGLQGKYINAGILLMNLKEIRTMNPDQLWQEKAARQYHYQDQDILNITCRDRITYLPLINNVPAHLTRKDFKRYWLEGLYTEEQCKMAWEAPVILHYTGEKPWNNRGTHKAKAWWDYVNTQEELQKLFCEKKVKNRRNYGMIGKINRHLPW